MQFIGQLERVVKIELAQAFVQSLGDQTGFLDSIFEYCALPNIHVIPYLFEAGRRPRSDGD